MNGVIARALTMILIAAAAAGCDQATKAVARDALAHHAPVVLLGGTVRLAYTENPGAFLSLGAGLSGATRRMIFGVAALIGLLALAVHAVVRPSGGRRQLVAVSAIAGGGAGNLIDRFVQGSVRDFMNVGAGPLRTGIFNVADMTIMAGIAVLLWDGWAHHRRHLRRAASAADWGDARRLLREYEGSLDFALDFQDFEHEMASLETEYAPPGGGFLLAGPPGAATGCVGVRRFSPSDCEMKRLYVSPASRGAGAGRRLAKAAIEEARRLGYARMLLDTVPSMQAARRLYASLGFVTRAPYRPNPIPGAVYMELDLSRDRRPARGVSGMDDGSGMDAGTTDPRGEHAS